MNPGFSSDFGAIKPPNFVNRVLELEALAARLSGGARLLVIHGSPGSGKSAFVHHFISANHELFLGGYHILHCGAKIPFQEIQRIVEREGPRIGRRLLVLEDVATVDDHAIPALHKLLQEQSNLYVLLVSRQFLAPSLSAGSVSVSDPLGDDAMTELLGSLFPSIVSQESSLKTILDAIDGHPLFATILAAPVRNGIATIEDLEGWLQKVPRPGLVGPDGRPIVSGSPAEKMVITDVNDVNDELLRMLKADPKLLLEISPRKFEEIVAELLSRRGYEVNLTRPSGDGGVDIYAARHDDIGRILYLVECKRYVPPNKVGVEIVRSLYGVVQSKNASAGMIVTTSSFTSGARQFEQELTYQMNLCF